MPKELTDEQIAEDIMLDDKDPLEAIREIRREEGVAEDDLPTVENSSEVLDDDKTDDDNQEKDDGKTPSEDKSQKKESSDEEEIDSESDEDKAAAATAAAADAAIEAADKAADAAADKKAADDKAADDYENLSDEEKTAHKKETDKEEAKKKADEKETTDKEDKKSGVRKFKANGQDFEFTEAEILEQFETVFGQSMNYTQKMQKIAPYRKMISALEQEGVTHDSLNLALDALKGDKGAIKKLLEKAKIDAYELTSEDEEKTEYVPKDYGKNETQLDIEEITSRIQGDEEFKITTNVIDEQWDETSRQAIVQNPNMIMGLHNDIKSGVYDTVAPMAMKMKVLDGNTKSDIEYYMIAGEQLRIKMEAEHKAKEGQESVDDLNKNAQNADSEFDKASSEAERKRAASSTGKRADRKGVIDYLDDDDEAFDEWYKKLHSSV